MTCSNMSTNYAYGNNKTHDAANFEIIGQNWPTLRGVGAGRPSRLNDGPPLPPHLPAGSN